jgi:hypothetical protein
MVLGERTRLLRTLRLASATLTVLAVGALGFFAATGGATVTRRTTVVRQATPARASTTRPQAPATGPRLSEGAGSSDGASALAADPVLAASSFSPSGAAVSSAAGQAAAGPSATTPGSPATPAAPASGSGPAPAAPTPGDLPACPLPLDAPADPGGLQSLVSFAPYLGPFSSEAFAMAPAVQPVLQTAGPFLVALANGYASAPPSATALATQVETLENEGYTVLSPLYGPNRSQLLDAETQLAAALAPAAEAAGDNEATSCLVDIEAALVPAAPSS